MDGGAGFVSEAGNDFAGFDVDDVTGGWVGVFAVDGEGDPAGFVAEFDVGDVFGRHNGVVVKMHAAVVGVGEPDFFFVGSEADAVAGATVAFGRADFEIGDFEAVKFFSGGDVADFEAEQAVEIHVADRAGAVDGEGADEVAERADFFDDGVSFGVGDAEERGAQAGEITEIAVGAVDGVVRAGCGFDALNDGAGKGVDDMPVTLFETWEVNDFAVGRQSEAIAAAGVGFFPEDFFGVEIEGGEGAGGGDVEAAGIGVGGKAFYVERLFIFVEAREGNAFDEFVIVINVENDDAVAAIFEVIADAGSGDVEQMSFGGGRDELEREGEKQKNGESHGQIVQSLEDSINTVFSVSVRWTGFGA